MENRKEYEAPVLREEDTVSVKTLSSNGPAGADLPFGKIEPSPVP